MLFSFFYGGLYTQVSAQIESYNRSELPVTNAHSVTAFMALLKCIYASLKSKFALLKCIYALLKSIYALLKCIYALLKGIYALEFAAFQAVTTSQ